MKQKIFFLLLIGILFSNYLFAQNWYVGGFINGGYSSGINAVYPEGLYEITGKGSIAHGLCIEYEFKKYSFQFEYNRLNIGQTDKKFNGFTPQNVIGGRVTARHPVFVRIQYNYNYSQFGFKGYYILNDKVKMGIGLHPSMINRESIWMKSRFTIAGEQEGPTKFGSVTLGYRNYENFQPYNLFISANFKYKIWKYIAINTSYIISAFHYNGENSKLVTGRKFYHQGVYGGLEFTYPF